MRRALVAALVVCLLGALVAPAAARPRWKRAIDRIAARRDVAVAVHQGNRFVLQRAARGRRRPASNQKLLASMALLDRLGPDFRMSTTAAARRIRAGVVRGNLWVIGRGDPAVTGAGAFARSLPFRATRIGRLARRIRSAGVRAIRGRVMGSRGYFARDWDAPGWRPYYQSLYIARPTALTFQGNTVRGHHVADPERHLASRLTRRLRKLGIRVRGRAGSGYAPRAVDPITRLRSQPLRTLLRYTNRRSSNFFAEVLGKRLAVARFGAPGTIASGARAISRWARAHGVRVVARDASGLSHGNRVSARGLVRLLVRARRKPWGWVLHNSLPAAGQGTLEERLAGVRLRAKTGTLRGVSALSGWVWRRGPSKWAAFSILSRGMPKHQASALEDRIVRVLARPSRALGAARRARYLM